MIEAHLFSLLAFISLLTPIAMGITEVLKKTFKEISPRFYTILAIIVAVGLASVSWAFTDLDMGLRLWGGLFAGLSGAGVYDITKTLANSDKKQ